MKAPCSPLYFRSMIKKVLVIEDNADIRENVIELIEMAGYEAYGARDGRSGVELATRILPDIILCDIMMPELDGYGVLHLLNKNLETGMIPVIFLTAKAAHADLRKGMELGADDYLTKPFDDLELLNAIESRLRKKELLKNSYSSSLERLTTLVSRHSGLAELRRIILERKSRPFKKNQVIYYEGDRGSGLYLVISGKIKTIKIAEDGRELLTGIYGGGDYLGINALLSAEVYTDTATAMEDCMLSLIPREQLDLLLDVYPDLGREFIRLLAADIREKEEQLLQLAYHSVRKRMAEAILRLYKAGQGNDQGIRISREDLAAMAGIATETVSRTLSDFKDEGLIEKKGSMLHILDPERLGKMKN